MPDLETMQQEIEKAFAEPTTDPLAFVREALHQAADQALNGMATANAKHAEASVIFDEGVVLKVTLELQPVEANHVEDTD